jgi:hypothetical protein
MKAAVAAMVLAIGVGICQAQPSRGPRQSLAVVTGTPFSADRITQTTWARLDGTPASETENGRYYRDSEGRIRIEGKLDGAGVWHTLEISNPVAGFVYRVSGLRGNVGYRSPLPSTLDRETASRLGAAEAARPSIGTQTIAGMLALGHQNVLPGSASERWISPQLVTTLMSKATRSSRMTTITLSNIVLAEPGPGLFLPPQGYTFLDSGN